MAGDWIKVECVTPSKPEVFKIAEHCDIEPEHAFGALLCVWIWADQHTEDGNALSVTKKLINRVAGVTDFADAMLKVGWLLLDDDGASFPNFSRHNGKTAKNRALTAKRVAEYKQKSSEKSNAKVTQGALPREEKRREEISQSQNHSANENNDGENVSDYNAQKAAMGGKAAEPIPKPKKKRKRAVSAADGSVATPKAGGKAAKYTPEQYQLAVWMSCPVKQQFPKQDIKLDEWAEACRKLIEIDGYTLEQIEWIWRQVTSDDRQGFNWSTNCRTPMKLRAKKDGLPYFEIIKNQFNRGKPDGTENRPAGDSQQSSGRENLQQRIRRQTTEWANGQGVGQGEGSSTGS